jgi:hypothetical protein
MAHAWRPAAPDGSDGGALALDFAPATNGSASAAGWAARVTLTTRPSLGAVFDLALALVAAPRSGGGYTELLFPSELLLDASALAALHLPVAPGVALLPPFFAAGAALGWSYPGSFAFASFVQLDFGGAGAAAGGSNGSLVLEDLSGPDLVVPVQSYLARAGGKYAAQTWFLGSSLPVNLTAGCASFGCAMGSNGTVTRRFVLSAAPLSPLASARAYTAANGMVAGGGGGAAWPSPAYSTIREKLAASGGGAPRLWRQVFEAPLLKLDLPPWPRTCRGSAGRLRWASTSRWTSAARPRWRTWRGRAPWPPCSASPRRASRTTRRRRAPSARTAPAAGASHSRPTRSRRR